MVKSSFSLLFGAMGRDLGLEIALPSVAVTGKGELSARFPVTEFATASLATAGCALRALLSRPDAPLYIDQRLASYWFSSSHFPVNRAPAALWNEFAGDYATRDGWIRLAYQCPASPPGNGKRTGCEQEQISARPASYRVGQNRA